MKREYNKQFSYYEWLTKYHGVEKVYFNNNKTKCNISKKNKKASFSPFKIKDRIFYNLIELDLLLAGSLIKFSNKTNDNNDLIKNLCYEKDYNPKLLINDDFYAREHEKFPWNVWMSVSFFNRKTNLYDPKKHFTLTQENNKKIICHVDALSFVDRITVADTTLFGILKYKDRFK